MISGFGKLVFGNEDVDSDRRRRVSGIVEPFKSRR